MRGLVDITERRICTLTDTEKQHLLIMSSLLYHPKAGVGILWSWPGYTDRLPGECVICNTDTFIQNVFKVCIQCVLKYEER